MYLEFKAKERRKQKQIVNKNKENRVKIDRL